MERRSARYGWISGDTLGSFSKRLVPRSELPPPGVEGGGGGGARGDGEHTA